MADMDYIPVSKRYDSGIRYRRCGRSGVMLPEISLGLWHNFGDDDDFSNAVRMAHHAFDLGIVHFDLANNYGPPYGSAEKNFGRIMKDSFRPYRDELFISTKAGHDMWPGPYGEWCSRKNLIASLDQSLKRMNLDYVDVFYSHRYDPETPLEETLQALVDIVRSGKALYAGISKYPPEASDFAYKYLRDHGVPCLVYQGRYNMLSRVPEESGIISQACENGAGFVCFSPLAQGLLSSRYLNGIPAGSRMTREHFLKSSSLTPELLSNLKELDGMAQQRGQSLSQMALAWCLKDNKVTSVITGASSIGQIDDNFKALECLDFSAEELEKIDRLTI